MTETQIDFTVFYSWQSDLPDETNRRAIRSALRTASLIIEAENANIRIVQDEATRGESGSPSIPHTILDKIKACDAFVCDITTINASATEDLRRTPNPNVVFELGYAVAHLGWNRIVMLFNKELGNFPEDAPFDVDRHRASPYRLSPDDPENKSNHRKLEDIATNAIRAIVDNQPLRPFESLQQTPEEVRHLRDIKNINWAMATIHIPTVDAMISDLPRYLCSRALHCWLSFDGVITSSLFHVYDEEASDTLLSIHKAWSGCVSHGGQYHTASNPDVFVFANPMDFPLDRGQEREWNEIESASDKLRKSLDKLLGIIRERYLEIDIDEMSKKAWQEYVDFHKEMDHRFER